MKKEREGNRWSLEQMAERLRAAGIQQARATTVHKIESGERRMSLDELAAYANIFRMGVADLVLDRRARVEDLHRRFIDQMDTFGIEMTGLMNICVEADSVLGESGGLLAQADAAITSASAAFELLNRRFEAVLAPMLHTEFDHGSLL